MASFIDGGTLAFDQLMYAPPTRSAMEFLDNRRVAISQGLTEAGRTFMDTTRDVWSNLYGEGAARLARAAVRQVQSLWDTDIVRQLVSMAQMQNAPVAMQRWVMAEPYVREQYLNQKLDGYSDSYVNTQGSAIGADQYDYRRVMNGIVVDVEDEGWSATTWFEELDSPEDELYFDQQTDIIHTWGNIVRAIRRGKDDPTSRWNSSL